MRIDALASLLPLGTNPDTLTASGYSLGAYMAHEMAVIHSHKFKGVGLVAGGLFDMSIANKTYKKFTGKQYAEESQRKVLARYKNNEIDEPSNISKQRVY